MHNISFILYIYVRACSIYLRKSANYSQMRTNMLQLDDLVVDVRRRTR